MRRNPIAVFFLGFYLLSGITPVPSGCENCGCCDIGKNTCQTKECTSCLDGHWGGRCYIECPAECLACAKEPVFEPTAIYLKVLYHVCTKCVDGKYLGNTEQNMTCKLSCPKECITCTSLENCTSCKTGYYHENGRCISCSEQNMTCKLSCPDECTTCTSLENCTSCKTGYYHENGRCISCSEQNMTCKLSCPDECTTCTSLENCTSCKTGYYHENGRCISCSEQNMTCKLSCPDECTTCTSLENCTSCKTGYYHENGRCILCSVGCTGGACDNTTGTCLCKLGFAGKKCDDCADTFYGQDCTSKCPNACFKQMCEKDSGNCIECFSNFTGNLCENCVTGVYGNTCNSNCPKNCRDNICHRNTGNCFNCTGNFLGDKCNICTPGKYGADCTMSCHPNCRDRICIKDSGQCIQCSDGFTGPTCDQCSVGLYSQNCSLPCLSPNCKGHVCNRDSGLCEQNELCAEGWYGISCNNRCSNGCKFGNCSRENGVCLNGCKSNYSGDKCCVYNKNCLECSSTSECFSCVSGFYGEECQFNCSSSCTGGCLKVSGECNGCIINSFGALCNLTCSDSCKINDNYPRCNESNGACLFGCGDGFYGSMCKDECINTCTNNKCDRQQGTCRANEDLYTSEDLVKKLAIAVVTTCLISVMVTLAFKKIFRFVRVRFVRTEADRKGNRHKNDQTGTYDTLEAEGTNQMSYYDTVDDILRDNIITHKKDSGYVNTQKDSQYANTCV